MNEKCTDCNKEDALPIGLCQGCFNRRKRDAFHGIFFFVVKQAVEDLEKKLEMYAEEKKQ